MKLSVAFGVTMALVWAVGAVLIGITPGAWGGGIAMSVISGMALGGLISVALKLIRARRKTRLR